MGQATKLAQSQVSPKLDRCDEHRMWTPDAVRAEPVAYNRWAWDRSVEKGNRWTIGVLPEAIEAARRGQPELVLTPKKPIPPTWLEDLRGQQILGLAAAGGQQGPLLAAAGARVTVMDISRLQLDRDVDLADTHGLELEIVEADMTQGWPFETGRFDVVLHPSANAFVPDVEHLWREAARVLRPRGELWAGFCQPGALALDERARAEGRFALHPRPYCDVDHADDATLQFFIDRQDPVVWAHELHAQLGGQLRAGFTLVDLYEDVLDDVLVDRFLVGSMATRAWKAS